MRNVLIDLSNDIRYPSSVFAGYTGEHKETKLTVTLPSRMLTEDFLYYYFEFQTVNNKRICSPMIAKSSLVNDNQISVFLWSQLLVYSGDLKFCVTAVNSDTGAITIKAKTAKCSLKILSSANGKDTLIDETTNKEEIQKMIEDEATGAGIIAAEAAKQEVLSSVDQTYSPESENAQSGKAVAEAVEPKADKLAELTWLRLGDNTPTGDYILKAGTAIKYTDKYYDDGRSTWISFGLAFVNDTQIHISRNPVESDGSYYLFVNFLGGYVSYHKEVTSEEGTNLTHIGTVSDYSYATTDYVDTKIGDIDTTLDSIIALQNSYIGGNA